MELMSGMAEVLAAHQWCDATTDSEDPATGCTGCDDWFGSEDALDDGTFAAHQADALSAAGFGPVKEAAAKALEDAAEDAEYELDIVGEPEDTAPSTWLRARAAAVRGDS